MKKVNQILVLMIIAAMAVMTFTGCKKKGCTGTCATNYDSKAKKDDDSCKGCTDLNANNYCSYAIADDGSCTYTMGCTDPNANNYNLNANKDDGSCTYPVINLNSVTGDGDVTGASGTASATTTWSTSTTQAEYSMDITAAGGGSFQLIIKDDVGTVVLDKTLTKGVGDDSASGCTAAGTAGTWSITITVTNFNGDGSYTVDPAGPGC